ncbi:MAG: M14 family zinc carboxypeptidase [Gemmatimonadales bacterium]
MMFRSVGSTVRATAGFALVAALAAPLAAQQTSVATRDPAQKQDPSFEKSYKEWLPNPKLGSPLVDHLPLVPGIPTPKDVLGYHIGKPKTLTYYADQLRYYRALEAATPRVRIETIGHSDEGRELVVIWISSEANLQALDGNRAKLATIADPRGKSEAEIRELIKATKPHYHLMGGLHSGETGPSEMLMELAYSSTETSPVISGRTSTSRSHPRGRQQARCNID